MAVLDFSPTETNTNYVIGEKKYGKLSFFNCAVMNPSEYTNQNGLATFVWKHSDDTSEYFDIEIGILTTNGTLQMMINGTTSYNRFELSDSATNYLYAYASSSSAIYLSLKRYENYGFVKYDTEITYFKE